jgi:hypothetical protein
MARNKKSDTTLQPPETIESDSSEMTELEEIEAELDAIGDHTAPRKALGQAYTDLILANDRRRIELRNAEEDALQAIKDAQKAEEPIADAVASLRSRRAALIKKAAELAAREAPLGSIGS